jgi:hypothetical protein
VTLGELRERAASPARTSPRAWGSPNAPSKRLKRARSMGCVGAPRLYAQGLGARLELAHADGRREAL